MKPRPRALLLLLAASCGGGDDPPPAAAGRVLRDDERPPCGHFNPQKNVYFGDLHVHTSQSFDANAFGVRVTPRQAYAFARGAEVTLPSGAGTRTARLARPLDFVAVTDHSEFLAEVEACTTPGSSAYDSATCQKFRGDPYDSVSAFGLKLAIGNRQRFDDICGDTGQACIDGVAPVWADTKAAAEEAYDRSDACSFTSFLAYEYTGVIGGSTMHRNVIFRTSEAPQPITFLERPKLWDFWRELRSACVERTPGCDVLAIPHNPNESNGKMFAVEYPAGESEPELAALRGAMEPLMEVFQHKGDSECRNGLSGVLGAPDEQCDFEKHDRTGPQDCATTTTHVGGVANTGCYSVRDFLRGALLEGLKERERIGVNPLQLGVIAGTDTHNGTPGAVDEDTFQGHRGTDDDTPDKQLGPGVLTSGGIAYDPGGIAGVWAEQNTRASLFDALRRREVFGTSGPRITVRFFGGWGYDASLADDPRLVEKAYAGGVPMGGTLPAPGASSGGPAFVVSALRDPGPADKPGARLQRVQIVKGWVKDGKAEQRVFDVAGDASAGLGLDTSTCRPGDGGSDALTAVFVDPEFDPSAHAFYYARVLEVPTCRWSTWLCNRLPEGGRPAACDDPSVKRAQQERAWTSPIWYTP